MSCHATIPPQPNSIRENSHLKYDVACGISDFKRICCIVAIPGFRRRRNFPFIPYHLSDEIAVLILTNPLIFK